MSGLAEKAGRLDGWIGRHMAFVAPTCLVLGIVLAPWIDRYQFVVPFVFAFMTFQSSLGSGFRDVSGAFRRPLPILVALVFLHGVLPWIAYEVGRLLFGANPEIVTGMVLEFTVPTGIVTLIWVAIAGGNGALSLSLVFLDTVLAPFVVPAVLFLFGGSEIHIDVGMVWRMMRGLAFMVAIPAFLAVSLNQLTRGRVKTDLMPRLSLLTKFGFVVVIALNSTGLHEYVVERPSWLVAGIAATMGGLAVAGFFAGALAGRTIRAGVPTASSLILGIGMRNIAAGATLAAAYFPGQAVILPVMLATLFQQVLAATVGMGLIKRLK